MKDLKAKWIWRRGIKPNVDVLMGKGGSDPIHPEDKNTFMFFRKTFQLSSKPRKALVRVSADSRYRLFVNGEFICRGPARCEPLYQCVDEVDVADKLKTGKNVFAVLVRYYGEDLSWYRVGQAAPEQLTGKGGLLFQADIKPAKGKPDEIITDDTWKCLTAKCWEKETPRINFGLPRMEIFDAGKAPVGWASIKYDDSAWEKPAMLKNRGIAGAIQEPFPFLEPRDIPFLVEKEIFPTKVLGVYEIENVLDKPDFGTAIMREKLLASDRTKVEKPDASIKPGNAATVVHSGVFKNADGSSGRSAVIVYDFGETVAGYPRIDVDGAAGGIVDIAVSEKLVDNKPILHPFAGKHAVRYIMRDGRQCFENFEWSGFRYMMLIFRDTTKPVRLIKASCNYTAYPVGDRGRFKCSDEQLNRIWDAGRYTLEMCMHDGFEDCPSREQRQWVGDAYVQALINYAAFGDTKLVRRLLRVTAQSQRADGMTQMYTTGDYNKLGTTIPDYCLYWIMTLKDYWLYTGDDSLVEELYPAVMKAVSWFERYLDDGMLLNNIPHWIFVDWSDVDKRGAITVINAQFVRVLECVQEFAINLGDKRTAKRLATLAKKIASAINSRLWNPGRKAYSDCEVEGKISERVSQHSNAFLIASGIAPKSRIPHMMKTILDEPNLTMSGNAFLGTGVINFDETKKVVLAQPFFMHHVHRAFHEIGDYENMLKNIRARWGAMMDAGATTIWEVWNPHGSECHAWAATPTFDLSTYVLGVRPTKPGFDEFLIAPNPCDLDFAEGVFPSVKGDIKVKWQKTGNGMELEFNVPKNSTAKVSLPLADGRKKFSLKLDGKPSRYKLSEKSRAEFTCNQPGKHEIVLSIGR